MLDKRRKTIKNTYPLVFLISEGKNQKRISLGIKIEEIYWKNGNLTPSHPDYAILDSLLADKLSHYKKLQLEALRLNVSIFDLIETPQETSFMDFINIKAKHYEAIGKIEYSKKILQYAKDWSGKKPNDFHEHLVKIGNSINTIHKKFKRLRQLYTMFRPYEPNPFIISLKKEPVNRATLNTDEVKRIEDAPFSGTVDLVRDLWLFSYYCKGMRFTNVTEVQNSDIKDGRVIFNKVSKSNKKITVKIHEKLQSIIDKYKSDCGPLFHPISSQSVSKYLKVIADFCRIDKVLIFHTARHSIANNLQKKGIAVEVIRDVLGHSDVKITQQYLKSLDDEAIDKALDNFY